MILVYPRAFYLDQLERERPAGHLLEQTTEQVRVEIERTDMELLRHDAAVRSSTEGCPQDDLRLAARATVVRVRMASRP